MNENQIKDLLKANEKKAKKDTLGAIGAFILAIIFYVCMAYSIQYVYNDYAQLMQTGWQVITAGQVYFTLVAFSLIRLWFVNNITIIEHSKKKLTNTDNALATFGKFVALVIILLTYIVVKAIMF
jgi:uncharacterized membrane protein YcjF (UPF0283 family)